MQYSIRESKVLVDSECKRYFSFDGVVVGVLYLIHKYMPDYYLKQSYNEIYL